MEGTQEDLKLGIIQTIQGQPLAEYTLLFQTPTGELEKLSGIQIRRTAQPWLGGLRNDEVELLGMSRQKVARIDSHLIHPASIDPFSPQWIAVSRLKETVRRPNSILQLNGRHPPHPGEIEQRTAGGATAVTDHQSLKGISSWCSGRFCTGCLRKRQDSRQ